MHIKCAGFTPKEGKYLSHSLVYECSACINRKFLTQLPFADEIEQNCSLNNLDTEPDSTWESYDLLIAQKYRNNIKMGHINANGIGGFKFHEIKSWLLGGKFDILVVSETKLDMSFPKSQFYIHGRFPSTSY